MLAIVCRMPRRLRDKTAGTFHVYAHSVWAASALFRDDVDRNAFLRELARATAKVEWTCIGFCLMTTHYHLILDVQDGSLPLGMHALNFRYACQFNARHGMRGHAFGARYDSVRIDSDEHLLTAYKYTVMNPVRAGICDRPESWPWSSYAGTIGAAEPHSFVEDSRILECFDGPRELAVARLRSFVELS